MKAADVPDTVDTTEPKDSDSYKWRGGSLITLLLFGILVMLSVKGHDAQRSQQGTSDSIHVPSFELPASYFLDAESERANRLHTAWAARCAIRPGSVDGKTIAENRACLRKSYYPPLLERLRRRYSVSIEPDHMAGVPVEVIVPVDGVPAQNVDRVLINLHGGGFLYGGKYGGEVEAIPVAAIGKIKVVSVDYRMAPEYQFPAATEDVVGVFKVLSRAYRPENIGIYGCSAGATLTAQTISELVKEGSPLPGAIGMFSGGAQPTNGDSYVIAQALFGLSSSASSEDPYARNVDPNDPLYVPGRSAQIMARFPPSLLISSTRDLELSSVAVTHAQLVRLRVPSELHVWEGVDHCFLFNPELAASREAYDVIAEFFGAHLGPR